MKKGNVTALALVFLIIFIPVMIYSLQKNSIEIQSNRNLTDDYEKLIKINLKSSKS